MPEISYALRVAVINDVVKRAREVGAYQAYEWLESHLKYLEAENNGRISDETSDSD